MAVVRRGRAEERIVQREVRAVWGSSCSCEWGAVDVELK